MFSSLLMLRDAFTHFYTIKCWRWCCFPSRNLEFFPFLARGQTSRFCSSTRAYQKISMFLSLHQTSLEKSPSKTKKNAQAAAWTHQMLWLLFWVERKRTCVLEKEHGLLSHMCLCSNPWIIIWKTDIVTLLNRMCLYLYLMKCLSELVNW